jgi:hypothetical protein
MWLNLVIDELAGRLADHPLLLGEILGREDVGRLGNKKLTAFHVLLSIFVSIYSSLSSNLWPIL